MSKLILWRLNYRTPFQTCHELGQVPCGSSMDSDRVDKLGEPASGMAEYYEAATCSYRSGKVFFVLRSCLKICFINKGM